MDRGSVQFRHVAPKRNNKNSYKMARKPFAEKNSMNVSEIFVQMTSLSGYYCWDVEASLLQAAGGAIVTVDDMYNLN